MPNNLYLTRNPKLKQSLRNYANIINNKSKIGKKIQPVHISESIVENPETSGIYVMPRLNPLSPRLNPLSGKYISSAHSGFISPQGSAGGKSKRKITRRKKTCRRQTRRK